MAPPRTRRGPGRTPGFWKLRAPSSNHRAARRRRPAPLLWATGKRRACLNEFTARFRNHRLSRGPARPLVRLVLGAATPADPAAPRSLPQDQFCGGGGPAQPWVSLSAERRLSALTGPASPATTVRGPRLRVERGRESRGSVSQRVAVVGDGFLLGQRGGCRAREAVDRRPPVRAAQPVGRGPARGRRRERLPGHPRLGSVRALVSRPHRRRERGHQGAIRVRVRGLPASPSLRTDRLPLSRRRVATQGDRARRTRASAGELHEKPPRNFTAGRSPPRSPGAAPLSPRRRRAAATSPTLYETPIELRSHEGRGINGPDRDRPARLLRVGDPPRWQSVAGFSMGDFAEARRCRPGRC